MPRRPPSNPIVTLTTDFGLSDAYVAVMKAAILRECASARLIDVTHNIAPQDVLSGSIALERAVEAFPEGTVHSAVVDPGVGTNRRMLIVELNKQLLVCPDNGLVTWAWRLHGGGRAHEIAWRPRSTPSNTFHGRDIFAPVAGMLASGRALSKLGKPIDNPVLLDVAPAVDARRGVVIHVDHYGNATTSISQKLLNEIPVRHVRIRGSSLGELKRTYADVAPGKPLALIGSSGLLEIAVRNGSAQKQLRIKVGDNVRFS